MNRKTKLILFIGLIILQVLANKYINILHINIDLLFLFILYFCMKSNYYKCLIIATIIGLITDVFSMNILGVFGFSRVLIAFFAFNLIKYMDIKRKVFIFLLVFVSLSASNLIASCFFYLLNSLRMDVSFILISPIITAAVAVVIISFKWIRESLNVY